MLNSRCALNRNDIVNEVGVGFSPSWIRLFKQGFAVALPFLFTSLNFDMMSIMTSTCIYVHNRDVCITYMYMHCMFINIG